MTVRESINKFRAKLYNFATDFNVVKISAMCVMIGYILLLIIGVTVATFLDPDGYTIWDNWISDLGSLDHTPAPFLYDIACIVAGSMTIPLTFYMEKLLAPLPKRRKLREAHYSRLRFRLSSFAFLFSIIGNFAYIGVGIFSADRDYEWLEVLGQGPHGLMSYLAFGGFTFGAFFMGWIIVLYNTKIPKILGIYGILGPLTVTILNLINGTPLLEWMLLFSILIWIIPLSLIILMKSELNPR
ncbi:MAG: hypothetical protein JSV62_16515 [Promethearchaeota archaeon]|nr:MAG: hypothetical protein JSV62_16515 [Candidatus Lokiarchaeota archaeon]